jgi:hypothetical protein
MAGRCAGSFASMHMTSSATSQGTLAGSGGGGLDTCWPIRARLVSAWKGGWPASIS